MNFDDINFGQRGGTYKPGLGYLLPGGYWVKKKYFEVAWKNASENLHKLDWKFSQTAESLCGKPCWLMQSFGERIALGRCIKYFVDHEMLPLRLANPGKKGKRKYLHQ